MRVAVPFCDLPVLLRFFWKASDAPTLDKDAAASDFDSIECGYRRLRDATVLCADYAHIRRVYFPLGMSTGEAPTNAAIDQWLLDQVGCGMRHSGTVTDFAHWGGAYGQCCVSAGTTGHQGGSGRRSWW